MGRDNHLLEIPGKKLHPMIAAQKWTSFLWFSKEPGRLPCCWVALCHFAHCLDCLSRSVTSEIFCGTPSAWQTSGCDHCLFTFSHNKMGTSYEDCFSSPCSSFKFLVLCPVTPLIATHPRLLSVCLQQVYGPGELLSDDLPHGRVGWGQSRHLFNRFTLE